MRPRHLFFILATTFLLCGCKDLPVDIYSIPFEHGGATILTSVKLKELKQEFHRLCKEHGLRQNDENEPPSDSYVGIWYIYMLPHEAGDRKNFISVIFERDTSVITILVRTDGSVPESEVIKQFNADLLNALNRLVGPNIVNSRREYSSGIN